MLRVIYRVDDLEPGVMAAWSEDRGLLELRIARGAKARDFIPPLNDTLRDCLSKAHWYQIWNGEVISADHPQSPLRCTYEVSPFEPAPLVDIREHKGHVALYVPGGAKIEDIVKVLNPSIEEFLAGGQWFQLWHGEIVTMDSPDSLAA